MIELQRVYKRYPGQSGRAVLDAIDLQVAPGEVVLLSGSGGAGKSTLLGLLYGACFATSGTVSVFGRDVARLRRSSIALLRRCVGVVPQSPALMLDSSVFDNVAITLEAQAEPRRTIRARTMSALQSVGLAERARCPITRLAAGETQWTAIARALVGEPQILIADEPTAHLDRHDRKRFIELVTRSGRRGAAAVIATNDHKLLCAGARYGWRHVELRDGALEVIADRKPEIELARSPAIETAEAAEAADTMPGVDAINAAGARPSEFEIADTLEFGPEPATDDTEYASIEVVAVSDSGRVADARATIRGAFQASASDDRTENTHWAKNASGAFGNFGTIDAIDALWTVDANGPDGAVQDNPDIVPGADEHRATRPRAGAVEHRAAENVVPFRRAAAGGSAE